MRGGARREGEVQPCKSQSVVRRHPRHPVGLYSSLVLLLACESYAPLDGPKVLRGHVVPAADAEDILFPVLVLGVCAVGL
jgi:hypothetical protein